ncbi:MAG TPA: type II toxin-antitoxin system HicB family antitoxin [Roseiflexaceae bacterium]|jgi:predicted RNase H-like HicB family nuclease|nr:type II toxin-antitoxin system HicB family antitoxin [Roseiflexaceae bacterium]
MKLKIIVHEAEEGGYWADVPAIPGCATQGETFEELLQNLYKAVEGCLSEKDSHCYEYRVVTLFTGNVEAV